MKFEKIYGNTAKNHRYTDILQKHQKDKIKSAKSYKKEPINLYSYWIYSTIQKIYSKTKKYTVLRTYALGSKVPLIRGI